MSQLVSLPVLAALLGICYVASTIVYNLFFHSLRKYPGPISHRITVMAMAYYELRGESVRHVKELHEKYGKTVRIAPNDLSFTEEQAWTDIYGHQNSSGTGNLPKDLTRMRPEDDGTVAIINANEADHRRIRRIQTPMFSDKAIGAQEEFIQSYVSLLISRLKEKAGSPSNVVDLVQWYNYTTFDILGELAFGESFNCLKTDFLDSWIETTQLLLKDGTFWAICHRFPWPLSKLLYRMVPFEIRNSRHERAVLASRKVHDRIVRSSDERIDFMSYILKHNDEKGMTSQEINLNARILIIAGSETTATLLAGLTHSLLLNPHHLDKLTNIIRTTFTTEEQISVRELYKLEYLSAVIDEGFRTYPPVPGGLLRRTTPGGSVICGEVIPENSTVSVHILASNMSSRNWADADKFVPERWYKDEKCPEKYRSDKRKVMQPFSYGPRNCIGKNMALAEMRIILARLLWNFDFELEPRSLDWKNQRVFGLWEKKPLYVKLHPRKNT